MASAAERELLINALLIDNNTGLISPEKARQALKIINDAIQITDPASVAAVLPLDLNAFNNTFSLPKASEIQDGYIAKEDFQKLGGTPFLLDYISTSDTYLLPFGVKIQNVYISQGWRFPRTQWTQTDRTITLVGTSSIGKRVDLIGVKTGTAAEPSSQVASAANVGFIRYRVVGNNSYFDMVMQTGPTTYAFVNIVQNNW
jgi:hypothetical protein